MTREEFVEGYMTRSRLLPYTLDGEIVTYTTRDAKWEQVWHALECRCEADECDGWAMIRHGAHNWHKFQNDLTGMTYAEAIAADEACRS